MSKRGFIGGRGKGGGEVFRVYGWGGKGR